MAKRANPAKTRLLAKARKIGADVLRYANRGYVTSFDAYEADDRKLHRQVDSLYDLARKHGLSEDPDVNHYRAELRRQLSEARERAQRARSAYYKAMAGDGPSIWGPKRTPNALEQAFADELKIGEARRRTQRG